jgi:hypothetical protein
LVQLGPCLDEAALAPGKGASKQVYGFDPKDRSLVLAVRVEVRRVMGSARFREHADHDSEEAGELRHAVSLHARREGGWHLTGTVR